LSKKIILIAGPTASGKSKLAVKIANKINGEIINADSMQVYNEFRILSSRPTNLDIKKAKHHLYGFISVKQYFSTGEWIKLVKKKIKEIFKKNKVPILTGGTGLYFNAITKGISRIPEIKFKNREQIRKLHNKIGQKKFYEQLLKMDPLVKNKISEFDSQRAIRAFEVKKYTKKSLYKWISNTKSDFRDCDIRKIFIEIPRLNLLKKIEKRTEQMFKKGCIKEVENFLLLNIDKSLSVNKLIGIQEIREYLSNNISIEDTKELINIKTRQYAKSQNTWSRGHMKNWIKLYSNDLSNLSKKVLKVIS